MIFLDRGMDLASQCSVLKSVEENELTPERVPQADSNTTNSEFSGSYENVNLKPDNGSATPAAAKETPPDSSMGNNSKAKQSVGSPPIANSPAGASPPTTKGYGLKKWRRIRRDIQAQVRRLQPPSALCFSIPLPQRILLLQSPQRVTSTSQQFK